MGEMVPKVGFYVVAEQMTDIMVLKKHKTNFYEHAVQF